MAKTSRIELPETLPGSLLTGLDELDAQHAYFLGLVRESSELTDDGERNQVEGLVLEIARYAQCHFAFEEMMMKVYAYPNSEEHISQHAEILKSLERATITVPIQVTKLRLELLNWLLAHITLDDKELATFVMKNRTRLHNARSSGE